MAFFLLISWTFSDFCIETEDMSSLLKKILLLYPYILLTHFFKFNGISLLASLSITNLVNKKKRSPMQYHTCVLYIITNTSTRKNERGSRHEKKFLGILRKKEKKEKRNPLPFPLSAPPDTGFEIPTGA